MLNWIHHNQIFTHNFSLSHFQLKLILPIHIKLHLLYMLKLLLFMMLCIHDSCSSPFHAQVSILSHLSRMGCKFNIIRFLRLSLFLPFFLTLSITRSLTNNLKVILYSVITNLRCVFVGWNIFAWFSPWVHDTIYCWHFGWCLKT